MRYLREEEPKRGVALTLAEGISRIVAPNPGPMTYHGTNTYLLKNGPKFIVLDPGPEDSSHLVAIIRATSGQVDKILLSHFHTDHAALARTLSKATGAPVYAARGSPADHDVEVEDGDNIDGLSAIHTPGHSSDHLCFAKEDQLLFSGDHVMAWSASIIAPPNGDMAKYRRSLEALLRKPYLQFLPGHGPSLANPQSVVSELVRHLARRRDAIHTALLEGRQTVALIAEHVYRKSHPRLIVAAQRNTLAHLLELESEGLVRRIDEVSWKTTP